MPDTMSATGTPTIADDAEVAGNGYSEVALGFDDEKLEWLAKKIINVSFMIYGPVMTTICVYGFCDIKALSRVCTLHGISEKHTNFVTLFVLFACFGFSIGVSFAMAMERTLDIAQSIFA